MFEKLDLTKKLDDREYDRVMPGLIKYLGAAQREAEKLGIPVIVLFEGVVTSGKGKQISHLVNALDPRGYDVYPVGEPDEAEAARPFFWRFWTRIPARGRISFFSRGWYHRSVEEGRVKKEDDLLSTAREINVFERELADDGYVIVKIYLHISKSKQKERLKKREDDPAVARAVIDRMRDEHKKYEKYVEAMESLIERTDMVNAPWTIVESHDRRFAELRVFTVVIEAFEQAISRAGSVIKVPVSSIQSPEDRVRMLSSGLAGVDLALSVSDGEYNEKLDGLQKAIRDAQCEAYGQKVPVVVLFEGWDAAGKGGDIKRLTESLDPREYTVVPIGPPSDADKAHHYLWRFWQRIPAAGHTTIFDRSWYGRVLVERVEGLCSPEEWQRAYSEFNDLESQLVSSGTVLVKFWLQISQDEQLKRFEARERDPDKTWKITADDWRNREKWDSYLIAVDDMLLKTSTSYAPWTIVESNDKNYSRIKVLETVLDAIETGLKKA